MSNLRKLNPESRVNKLSERLSDALHCVENKSDSKDINLGSPISPLRSHHEGGLATATSSSSSSSGSVSSRNAPNPAPKISDSLTKSHSGELSVSSETSPTAADSPRSVPISRTPNPDRIRSDSSTGRGSVTSPLVNVRPMGNICPSGKIPTTGMAANRKPSTSVLGSGKGYYGHGNIMRGGVATRNGEEEYVSMKSQRAIESGDPEEVKRAGNEKYNRGNFTEALNLYNRAITLSPAKAAYRSNRAAALASLGRLSESVKECEEALRLDPNFSRAHQRLASLFVRLGQVENARHHISFPGVQIDPTESQKLQTIEKHLNKCTTARRICDWKSVLREIDAAIADGADSSPQCFACRAEAQLKIHQIDDAELSHSSMTQLEITTNLSSPAKFLGMRCEAYPQFVRAQIQMALGRFEDAVTAAEKAGQLDPQNIEISVVLSNVRMVARARARGNDLFKSVRFTEACTAYDEGLRFDSSNPVLYCNRAACWFKLGMWEKSIEDCNQALHFKPNYSKALLRRAAANSKLERWADAIRDYEILRRELPNDNEVAEALFHAQVVLKQSCGEVHNLKFSGEMESVSRLDQFQAAISSLGVTMVHFHAASNMQCRQLSPFLDSLRSRSINFLKVDIEASPEVANAENVCIVPTFKIYKNGNRIKELVCPSRDVLEQSIRHYNLQSHD